MELRYEYTPLLKAEQVAELRKSVGWDGRVEKYRKKLGKSYFCVTCLDGERLVGYADVVSDGIDDAYIRDLIVNPAYQRRGIGSKLLAMIAERIAAEVSGLSWSISYTVGPYFAGLILDSANPNLLWALCGVIGLLAAVGFTFLNRVHGGAPALEAAAAD